MFTLLFSTLFLVAAGLQKDVVLFQYSFLKTDCTNHSFPDSAVNGIIGSLLYNQSCLLGNGLPNQLTYQNARPLISRINQQSIALEMWIQFPKYNNSISWKVLSFSQSRTSLTPALEISTSQFAYGLDITFTNSIATGSHFYSTYTIPFPSSQVPCS